jgi:hypothetical protein
MGPRKVCRPAVAIQCCHRASSFGNQRPRFRHGPRAFQTGDPRHCTYKQAQDHQWQVKAGEKSTTVFLYKSLEIDDEKAEDGKRVVPLLRTFNVFHVSQMNGVSPFNARTIEECPWLSDEATEITMKNSGVPVRVGGDRPFIPQIWISFKSLHRWLSRMRLRKVAQSCINSHAPLTPSIAMIVILREASDRTTMASRGLWPRLLQPSLEWC